MTRTVLLSPAMGFIRSCANKPGALEIQSSCGLNGRHDLPYTGFEQVLEFRPISNLRDSYIWIADRLYDENKGQYWLFWC